MHADVDYDLHILITLTWKANADVQSPDLQVSDLLVETSEIQKYQRQVKLEIVT